jgi:uncharacterized protein YnzC (UPF0291/DUF896 family)
MSSRVLNELIEPVGQCFTPEVARRIVNLRASPQVQSRLDELAEKSTEGTLTDEERQLYSDYVRAINFIGVLQAKARQVLKSVGN